MRLRALRALPTALLFAFATAGCTLFLAGDTPCDSSADCGGGLVCQGNGFCGSPDIHGVGGEGEGEGVRPGEGEGGFVGEGEGGVVGEGEGGFVGEGEGSVQTGEGEGSVQTGEGEGSVQTGEGEGSVQTGEGEGEGGGPPPPPQFVTLCGKQHAIPPWFDTHFARRVPLAFCDTSAPDENVQGLPATVILDGSNFAGFAQMKADGHDVIFVNESGTPHSLAYERQIFGGGTAVFNVLTESFNPHSGADDIWLYFDNPGDDTDRSSPATVYAQYASVWHFESGALLVDAKSGVNMAGFRAGANGTNVGSPPSAVGGVVGGAIAIHGTSNDASGNPNAGNGNADSFEFLQQFDGNSNPVTPPQALSVSQGTISALVNPTAASFGHIVLLGRLTGSIGFDVSCAGAPNNISCGVVGNSSVNLSLHGSDDFGLYVANNQIGANNFTLLSAQGAASAGSFHHLAGAWGGNSEIIVADGVGVGSLGATVTANFQAANVVLGMGEFDAVNNLNAIIDELRICTVPRDVAFLRAERQGYVKQLFQVGAIETFP